jgi:hypothetical protein
MERTIQIAKCRPSKIRQNTRMFPLGVSTPHDTASPRVQSKMGNTAKDIQITKEGVKPSLVIIDMTTEVEEVK